MRRKVIGHFKETLMAVCSTPSSPFNPGVPGMDPLLKFLFTETREEESELPVQQEVRTNLRKTNISHPDKGLFSE